MKRHTDDKKHCCDVCSKKFHSKYHLNLHRNRVHLNNKKNNKAPDNYVMQQQQQIQNDLDNKV